MVSSFGAKVPGKQPASLRPSARRAGRPPDSRRDGGATTAALTIGYRVVGGRI